eukprot:NODE_2151_length_666_cov_61.768233_g1814_i0.p1 GENE.NODE_2151_length_666_cov_61.768233_g1814_i0~~NODE_2151_length_666_cov_61.768233_g1814_i0.p1  ORF type:complete len:91 (+),score=6.70 NODE_2151_length_666_cov_61.768233_g1814_i0:90-362(+)
MAQKADMTMNADMTKDMVEDAKEFAQVAFDKFSLERDISTHIKREMEKKHKGTWQCIVGRNFGSFVTHETKSYLYFYYGQMAILLFKTCS